VDWIKTRILLKKLEAQLLYDVLPDGEERQKLSALIRECDECLDGQRVEVLGLIEQIDSLDCWPRRFGGSRSEESL
jgi:hypothetical protein